MQFVLTLVRGIDAVNEAIGRVIAWLALAMVLVQLVVVVMRYVFGLSVLAMQESIWYMHSIIFLVAAGYTLLHDGHVRIDIVYGHVNERQKAIINLVGVLVILLPLCTLFWVVSWPYVAAAWAVKEGSVEVSGIQGVYLLKTCMLIFTGTLAIQGISLGIKSALTIFGPGSPEAPEDGGGEHSL